jgi:hypothetical protein
MGARDGSRRPFEVVGATGSGLRISRRSEFLSCVRRAGYGCGSRRNGRPGSAISLPLGWARDWDNIPLWGSHVNLESMKNHSVQLLRYATVLVGGILAGGRAVEAARAWQEWRSWRATDPSGADEYRIFFMENAAVAIVSLCLAALLWHLLRPRQSNGAS